MPKITGDSGIGYSAVLKSSLVDVYSKDPDSSVSESTMKEGSIGGTDFVETVFSATGLVVLFRPLAHFEPVTKKNGSVFE